MIDELESDDREPVVVYRNGRRWVQQFEPVPLPESVVDLPVLRAGSVWLVTGGTGGLGLAIASALSSRFQVKLALVGRHATQSPAFDKLRAGGTEVLPIDAPLPDAPDADIVDGTGCTLMPGLTEAHAHPSFAKVLSS